MYAIPGCAPITLVSQPIKFGGFFLLMTGFKILKVYLCIYHLCSLWQGFIYISFITSLQAHFTQFCSHISVKIVNSSVEIRHEKLNCSFSRAQNKPMPLFKHHLNVCLQLWVGGEAAGPLSSPEYNALWTVSEIWKVLADFSLLSRLTVFRRD